MPNNKPILTAGNDFYLRVNVCTVNAQGEREPFNLSACDKWAFFLRNTYGAITKTTFGLEEGSLNTILVDCKDIKRSMGYTAEVVAVLNGRNLRCAERGVFAITGYNADANVTFEVYEAEEGQVIVRGVAMKTMERAIYRCGMMMKRLSTGSWRRACNKWLKEDYLNT